MSDDRRLAGGNLSSNVRDGYAEVRLLLEQRDLNGAADRCARLLRTYPNDAEAHALMGDVYAARQLWPEAVEWYTLAEQLGAGAAVGERRLAAQTHVRATPAAAPLPAPVPVADLHRQRMRVRGIFIGSAIVVVLAVVLALLALSSAPRPRVAPALSLGGPPPPTTPGTTLGTMATTPAAGGTSVGVTPPAPTRPGTAGSGVRAQPGVTPSGTPAPVIITREMTVPATDEDFLIARAVSALTWPNGQSMSGDVAVMMDPYQAYCMITFRLPDSLPAARLTDTVIEQAYKVAVAALAADRGITAVTLRAITTVPGSDHRSNNLQAFRANVIREAQVNFAQSYPNPTAAALRQYLFQSFWWNPVVRSG
ncbi:MAG TPA: hypothetical protein VGM19_13470 [Armatimonadota bacterium]